MRITFAGHGPQEDELRYLADFLRLEGRVRFVTTTPAVHAEMPQADAVLDISEAQQQGWRVTRDGSLVACLPFGEVENLKDVVEGGKGD